MMEQETIVRIETSMGNIRVKLYNDTPQHRDNFIKLVNNGVYEQVLFHRVIRNFMIQAGDPASKPANMRSTTDARQYDYTIPAEIVYPKHFHKRGALAAARLGNETNPEKASSSTQFYIVTGKIYDEEQLNKLYESIYQQKVEECLENISRSHMKELFLLRRSGNQEKLQTLLKNLQLQAEKTVAQHAPEKFNSEQEATYASIGGAPHLDGEYTVFGEVIDGMDIVTSIENTETRKDRPIENIYIQKAYIEKNA